MRGERESSGGVAACESQTDAVSVVRQATHIMHNSEVYPLTPYEPLSVSRAIKHAAPKYRSVRIFMAQEFTMFERLFRSGSLSRWSDRLVVHSTDDPEWGQRAWPFSRESRGVSQGRGVKRLGTRGDDRQEVWFLEAKIDNSLRRHSIHTKLWIRRRVRRGTDGSISIFIVSFSSSSLPHFRFPSN